jgi:Putative motility protein
MDLVNAAIGMRQAENAAKVQYAVARKMLDMQQVQGAAVVKLIDAAAKNTVEAGDKLIAAATGLGGNVDTYA